MLMLCTFSNSHIQCFLVKIIVNTLATRLYQYSNCDNNPSDTNMILLYQGLVSPCKGGTFYALWQQAY